MSRFLIAALNIPVVMQTKAMIRLIQLFDASFSKVFFIRVFFLFLVCHSRKRIVNDSTLPGSGKRPVDPSKIFGLDQIDLG